MILIDSIEDLVKNLDTVESYLNGENDELFEQMADLVRRGRNFVAYEFDGATHFAPSRFVGYKNNTLPRHLKKDNGKNGSETSSRLRSLYLLGQDSEDTKLYKKWKKYCEECGVEPTGGDKTFWILKDYEPKVSSSDEFAEGKKYYARHLAYERNHGAIKKAKELYLQKHGSVCQICGFDFQATYGDVGRNYIEAHHTKPVSERDEEGEMTRIEDLVMVCANCHRMLHRRKPILKPQDLKKILNSHC